MSIGNGATEDSCRIYRLTPRPRVRPQSLESCLGHRQGPASWARRLQQAASHSRRQQQSLETRKGNKVVLCRNETSPDDLKGMLHSQGILTSRGGVSSHAALVARQLGKCLHLWRERHKSSIMRRSTLTTGKTVLKEGDYISIDGSTGADLQGHDRKRRLGSEARIDGNLKPGKSYTYELFQTVMSWADK